MGGISRGNCYGLDLSVLRGPYIEDLVQQGDGSLSEVLRSLSV